MWRQPLGHAASPHQRTRLCPKCQRSSADFRRWGREGGLISHVLRPSFGTRDIAREHSCTCRSMPGQAAIAPNTGEHEAHSMLALCHDPSAGGSNLRAVWYINDDLDKCLWIAKTWIAGDVADAVKSVKTDLNIDGQYDDKWTVAMESLAGAVPMVKYDYENGFLTDDPMKDPINASLNRNELVDLMKEWGYAVADMPLEQKDENGVFQIQQTLSYLASITEHIEWIAQAPAPALPNPFPPGVPTVPGMPIPTTTTPNPVVVPGQVPPGQTLPTAPVPNRFQRFCGITPSPNCVPLITGTWSPNTYTGCVRSSTTPTTGGGLCLYNCTVCRSRAYFEVCTTAAGISTVQSFGVETQCWTDENVELIPADPSAPCPATITPPAQSPAGPPTGTPPGTRVPIAPVTPPPPPPPPGGGSGGNS